MSSCPEGMWLWVSLLWPHLQHLPFGAPGTWAHEGQQCLGLVGVGYKGAVMRGMGLPQPLLDSEFIQALTVPKRQKRE